jgi:cytochrome c-type biogenesis protein CcmH/NrfF
VEDTAQDTSGSVSITISKRALVVISGFLILGLGLAAGYFLLGDRAAPVASVAVSSTPALSATAPTVSPTAADVPQPLRGGASVRPAELAQPVSAEEMFSEFTCPCCGKLIGDCTCGMAGERRGFVSGLVSAGTSKLDIYLAYADQYGLDSFASPEVKGDIREYKLANAPAERPQIVIEPQRIDLGKVAAKQGKVETSMTISNDGQGDLVIDGLSTSCGCTMASVVNDGQQGPLFGAGTPSTGWSTTIRPGDTAKLKIYYDPDFHEEARGAMVREIYVSSNDPVDPVVKARIELNQVD